MQPFVIYNPKSSKCFHTTACKPIIDAQQDGRIKNFVRVPVGKKLFIMHDHTLQRLPECQNCIDNKFAGITGWSGIKSTEFIWPDCFLLYVPAAPSAGFHFMKCKKVCKDLEKGWTGAYRFSNKSWFEDYDGNIINVAPCADCLSEWNKGKGWRGNFSIYGFFAHCLDYRRKNNTFPPDLKELYELKDNNTILTGAEIKNDYPTNWAAISDAYRMSRDYRCEECKVDLSEQKNHHLCVTHHINGCHFDVRPENMKVFCVYCHSQKPYHKQATTQDLNSLEQLWREQNII